LDFDASEQRPGISRAEFTRLPKVLILELVMRPVGPLRYLRGVLIADTLHPDLYFILYHPTRMFALHSFRRLVNQGLARKGMLAGLGKHPAIASAAFIAA
jgi:hypothetical protein